MKRSEFLENCTACGGNWTAMLMSGIKKCFPDEYAKMENRDWTFDEIYKLTQELGVEW